MLQEEEVLYQALYEVSDEHMDNQNKVISGVLICLSIGALVLFFLSYII
jgi:hypothetical protein